MHLGALACAHLFAARRHHISSIVLYEAWSVIEPEDCPRLAGQQAPNPGPAPSPPFSNGNTGVYHQPGFSMSARDLSCESLLFKMSYDLFRNKLVTTVALIFPGDKSDLLVNKCRLELKKSEIMAYSSHIAVSC